MKDMFKFNIVLLLLCGVFGDADEEKLSVMEGDSLTLHTGLTDIQNVLEITWTIGEEGSRSVLVKLSVIHGRVAVDVDERFRGRLQVDFQTGDVTITNMKIKHTGLYQAKIIEGEEKYKKFRVTVNESPRVSEFDPYKVKLVSVMEGQSVTLTTDVTELHRDDLIVWRFGDEGRLIAKDDKEDNKSSEYEDDEGFRGRLKLDHQTGSLIIKNITTTDAGVYKLKISSNNKQILHQTFSVRVRGAQFSVTVVVTCVVLLSLLVLVLLAIDAYLICHKVSGLRQIIALCKSAGDKRGMGGVVFHCLVKALLVLLLVVLVTYIITLDQKQIDGQSSTSLAVIFGVLQMLLFLYVTDVFWRISQQNLRGTCLGVLCLLLVVLLVVFVVIYTVALVDVKQMEGHLAKVYIVLLVLMVLSGIYHFRESFYAKLMKVQKMLVFEEESLILPTGVTELESDDVIELSFDNEVIAEFKKNIKISDDEKRFTDRLQEDEQTGSLIIRSIRREDAGLYKVKMSSSSKGKSILQFILRGSSCSQFNVTVTDSTGIRENGCTSLS